MELAYKDGKLIIKEWTINESEVLERINDFNGNEDKIKQYLRRCLRTGALALKGAQVGEQVDFIQKRFNSLQNEFDKLLENYHDEIAETFKEHQNEFSEMIKGDEGVKSCMEDYLGEKGALNETIEDYFGENGAFMDLFSLEKPDSPLKLIDKTFNERVEEIKIKMAEHFADKAARAEEREKSALKGYDYEDQVEIILNKITKPFGDVVQPVQTSTSGTSGKKGDFNIEVNVGTSDTPLKITVEAKAGDQHMGGKSSLLDILDKSMNERAADFAIATVRDLDALPQEHQSIGHLRTYGIDKIVCVANTDEGWLPLDVAYKIARSRLLMENNETTEIDGGVIKTEIESVINKINTLKGIQGQLTSISNNIKEQRDKIKGLKNEVKDQLNGILSELA
ncbi:MAG: hypothetical protein R6U96_19000 [Promethearchaeia archaeon]